MSSIPQNTENGNEISNSVTNFMTQFQIGKLLFKCNAGKQKGFRQSKCFDICSVSFSRIEACICSGKQAYLMVHSARTPFIASSIMRRLTGFGSQPCFQAGSLTIS